ncbi:hypothetical protein J5N97_014043 [Dioscorea zingiberensis]|uniref:Uncharacterized protein n=1 Tax=Dioscorea zingiberensis TaxID=325984 RepID=A0A9D5CTC4_9LILI|nr:hypothetical protein J5N97_014043 [Dioscorea zingiberensis]
MPMASEGLFSISVASVMEEVLKQHGTRLSDTNLASRKAEEAASRRYEAARWLRKTVGVVGAKDLPEEPSEEEFRLGLRNGLILCNALNKIQPGKVPKVVVTPGDSVHLPDGAALSAYQYFENVRNFLVAVQEMGFPLFEASDLEQGGKSTKNTSHSLNTLVRAVLSGKKPDEVPLLVESVLCKLMEELQNHITNRNEMVQTPSKDQADGNRSFLKQKVSAELVSVPGEPRMETEESNLTKPKKESCFQMISKVENDVTSKDRLLKQCVIFDQQERDIQELKQALCETRAGMKFMQMKYFEECNYLGKYLHSLAHAATGYHKVLEENRKLYNQVQDLKGNIRVYCRVRPFLPGQLCNSSVCSIDDGNISIVTPSKYGKEAHRTFNFNKVFGPSATQAEVFSDTQPLIRSVLDGYNVCIFAYGQTGSGKTFTMSGPKDLNEQSQGVNYRALSDLFFLSEQRRDMFCYEIAVQMIEIYNEQVRDLLNRLNVPSANLVPVSSTSDVIELMYIGQKNRAVGATALNDRSSRSHSCLTVHVQGRDMTSGAVLRGCMHLVDLAGSERVDKSEVTGERLKEAQHINKSLSALGDVIAALAQKSSHVPYRNSKLTQLLQDSLGGQAKTLMFVHISPEMDAIGETISTLKFAERVSTVELGAARANKESGEVKELKEQSLLLFVSDTGGLKAALARKGGKNIFKARSKYSSKQKKPSYDFQELLATNDSLPWLDQSPRVNFQKDDERDIGSGEWVDKIMVNREEPGSMTRDGIPIGDWEGDSARLPDLFYQRFLHDTTGEGNRRHTLNAARRKGSYDFDMQRNRFDFAMTDDSDELDMETSDSSEADMLWQFNLPQVGTASGGGSRIKKPHPKATKSPDIRTPSHSHIPPLSQKTSSGSGHGSGHATNRAGRQPISGSNDCKRSSSGGKMGNVK